MVLKNEQHHESGSKIPEPGDRGQERTEKRVRGEGRRGTKAGRWRPPPSFSTHAVHHWSRCCQSPQ